MIVQDTLSDSPAVFEAQRGLSSRRARRNTIHFSFGDDLLLLLSLLAGALIYLDRNLRTRGMPLAP